MKEILQVGPSYGGAMSERLLTVTMFGLGFVVSSLIDGGPNFIIDRVQDD